MFLLLLSCTELQILTIKRSAGSDEYNMKYLMKPEEKDHLWYIGVNGRIILKAI
jgi:hypothetical protein